MIPEFALRLICGLSLIWCIAPRKEITSGYFRIQLLIVLGLSVLMFMTGGQFATDSITRSKLTPSMALLAGLMGLLAYGGSVFWTLERRRTGEIACFVLAGYAAIVLLFLSGLSSHGVSFGRGLWIANVFSSAFLFGSITAAMLLGHWYLTATGMKLSPLIRLNQYFLAAVMIRIVVAGLMLAAGDKFDLKADWVLLTLRWAGLIGPLILAGLTISTLKYRNTQSATGVLYAATILVFMGEMAARLLEQTPPTAVA